MKISIVIIGLFLLLAENSYAIKWERSVHECPICHTDGSYRRIVSWGGYVYNWPSKYQFVFWPMTDGNSIYCCPKCHFSTFMCDFDSVPADKIKKINKYLKTVHFDSGPRGIDRMSVSNRLEVAEKIYKILGRNIEFWCKFHRVLGYHYNEEGQNKKAYRSRMKALNLGKKMLNDTIYSGQKKETLIICAAMYNFTGDKISASNYLDKANEYNYKNKNWSEEDAIGHDKYLSDLILQYKEFIKEEEIDHPGVILKKKLQLVHLLSIDSII